ncbi:MAG: hypothetical protein ACI92Z_001748 [Paracoccaceae bacterium]|jgi:hypothetical protein
MIRFSALPTDTTRALQSGAPDSYANTPERAVSDGGAVPCRHCLQHIPQGAGMLIFAHRPFPDLHPYAETGPIFLCEDLCERHEDTGTPPPVLTTSPDYLIKGYFATDRIVYGTGIVIPADRLTAQAETIFHDPNVAYIHVRSSRNNCYLARIDREDEY